MTNVPPDFTDALNKAGLAKFFAECTGPHQNEYLKWIAGAKQATTRQTRIAKAMQMLSAKRDEEQARKKKKPKNPSS